MFSLFITIIILIILYNLYLSSISEKKISTYDIFSIIIKVIIDWTMIIIAILIIATVISAVWTIGGWIYNHILNPPHHQTQQRQTIEYKSPKFKKNLLNAENTIRGSWKVTCGQRKGFINYKEDGTFSSNWNNTNYKGVWSIRGDVLNITYERSKLNSYRIVNINSNYYEIKSKREICKATRINKNTKLISSFDGTWRGDGVQKDGSSWSIKINIDSIKEKYTIDYPSLNCGGTLNFISTNANKIEFYENFTYGRNRCIHGKVILIQTTNNKADFLWYSSNGSQEGWGKVERETSQYKKKIIFENKSLIEKSHWKTEIRFDNLIKNKKSATIDFQALHCGGNLIYLYPENGGYLFKENLTYGRCTKGCKLWIRSDGKEYSEYCRNRKTGRGILVYQ